MNGNWDVLASIHAFFCEKIFSREKLWELRKSKPNIPLPFKVLVYCSKRRPGEHELFLDFYGGVPKAGWVFPTNHETAIKMNMLPLNGMVIGEFTVDRIETAIRHKGSSHTINMDILTEACVELPSAVRYSGGKDVYAWHIQDPILYEKPMPVTELLLPCTMPEQPYCPACSHGYIFTNEEEAAFYRTDGGCDMTWMCLRTVKRAPQSWCYVRRREAHG